MIPTRKITALAATLIVVSTGLLSWLLIWSNTLFNPTALKWNAWAFYEWLINYQAGFIRRGLVGEFIQHWFYNKETTALNYTAFVLGSAYLAFSLQLTLSSVRYAGAALIYVFSPCGFFWAAIANEYYFRKEMCFYLAIFILAALYRKWSKTPNSSSLAAAILTLIILFSLVLPLIHEASVFFCTLIFALILFNILNFRYGRDTAGSGLRGFLLLNLMIFILLSCFKGDAEQSRQIWASLSPAAQRFSAGRLSGGIAALGWSLTQAMQLPKQILWSGIGLYYLYPLALVYLINGYIQARLQQRSPAQVYASADFIGNFVLVFVCFLPLFVLGWDWGRWIFGINLVFSVMIFSGLQLSFQGFCALPAGLFVRKHAGTLFVSLLLLISLFSRSPECCIKALGSSYLELDPAALAAMLHNGVFSP